MSSRTKGRPKHLKPSLSLQTILTHVLSKPTAPFRESWVQDTIRMICGELKLPLYEDHYGNFWLGAKSLASARKSSLVFVAHMDHPGFIIEGFERKGAAIYAKARWLGGGPQKIKGHAVKIFSHCSGDAVIDGRIDSVTPGVRGPNTALIRLKLSLMDIQDTWPHAFEDCAPWGACLWFEKRQLPEGFRLSGTAMERRLVTKAADDLVGVCALIESMYRAQCPQGVVCLLSRAEESGFHGTIAVLEEKWLDPQRTLMVSVETSATLPGADIGKGPVVRLGDRATVFHGGLVRWIQERAQELANGSTGTVHAKTGFQFQRRVMDGGTCEASAFNAYGFKVGGLSVPLGNYHNLSKSGRAEPEEVAVSDVVNLSHLITHMMRSHEKQHILTVDQAGYQKFRSDMMESFKKHFQYF